MPLVTLIRSYQAVSIPGFIKASLLTLKVTDCFRVNQLSGITEPDQTEGLVSSSLQSFLLPVRLKL